MTKNEKLVWRLSKLPTPSELAELVKDKIITQAEAHEVLFSKETQEDVDNESLKSEIKFLRELVGKLSNNQTSKIVEVIREVEKPFHNYRWFAPYSGWVYTTSGSGASCSSSIKNATGIVTGTMTVSPDFTDIKTF